MKEISGPQYCLYGVTWYAVHTILFYIVVAVLHWFAPENLDQIALALKGITIIVGIAVAVLYVTGTLLMSELVPRSQMQFLTGIASCIALTALGSVTTKLGMGHSYYDYTLKFAPLGLVLSYVELRNSAPLCDMIGRGAAFGIAASLSFMIYWNGGDIIGILNTTMAFSLTVESDFVRFGGYAAKIAAAVLHYLAWRYLVRVDWESLESKDSV